MNIVRRENTDYHILINSIQCIFSSSYWSYLSRSIFFLLMAPFMAFMSFIFSSSYEIYCILENWLLFLLFEIKFWGLLMAGGWLWLLIG